MPEAIRPVQEMPDPDDDPTREWRAQGARSESAQAEVMLRDRRPGLSPEDYVRHRFPMGRLGTAEEVADVIVFIASPRAH